MRLAAYWITTALTAFVFLSGGATDLARPEFLVEGMTHLGYPTYVVIILGVWKILGGIVVLGPRLPRLKEWAYAGMVFDLTGAAASHAARAGADLRATTWEAHSPPLRAGHYVRRASRRAAARALPTPPRAA